MRNRAYLSDLLEARHPALLARLGEQLSRRGVGRFPQQFLPAGLLVHSLADKRRIQNRAIEEHGEPAFHLSGQNGRPAKPSPGQRLGERLGQLGLAGQGLRE